MTAKETRQHPSPTSKPDQEYLRILFDQSPVGLALCRTDGVFVKLNSAFAGLFGCTVKEMLQLNLREVIPQVYAHAEQQLRQDITSPHRFTASETIFTQKTGDKVPLRLRGSIVDLDGENYIWCSVEDISDGINIPDIPEKSPDTVPTFKLQQKDPEVQTWEKICKNTQTENTSSYNEAKYQAILDSAVDGIITINKNGIIDSFNLSAERMFGYTAAEVIGKNISILMPEPYSSSHNRYMQNYLSSNEAKIIGTGREVLGLRKDGSTFDIYLAVGDANVAGQRLFTGIVRDITELKQAQIDLQKSEERFRRSQRFANIGTWDWNIRSGDLYWSERIATLFGYREGELDTTYENFLNAVHPDDRQRVIDAVNNCIEHGEEYHIEHRCLWPNGEIRWLLERGDVIRDKKGEPLHMLGVVQDVSIRKQVEADLQATKEEAERSNQAKSEFLSSMNHELRTPLNAILGFAQLLGYDNNLNEEQRETIADIQRAGNHLLELIDEVLDLAKIEAGHVTLSLEPVSLAKVIDECCILTKAIADKKGISIVCDCHVPESTTTCSEPSCSDTPRQGKVCISDNAFSQYYVYADYTRLKQVLLNLLSNAVKYNRTNGTVKLRFSRTASNGIRIEIEDSGSGIIKDKLDQLFQPFNRLGAESGSIEGTGIGLVITKRYVEMMSGSIGVKSEPGSGSTFWIELPQVEPGDITVSYSDSFAATEDNNSGDECQSSDSLSRAETVETTAQAVDSIERKKLLVVEDNFTNQIIIKKQLKILGYAVDIASNATQGYEWFTQNHYSAILTDINLPEIDGFEFTSLVRQYEKNLADKDFTPHIPIIAVTANALKGEAEKCLDAGMDDYIPKPVDLHNLGHILNKYVDQSNHSISSAALPVQKNPVKNSSVVDTNAVDIKVLRNMLGNDTAAFEKVLQSYRKNSRHIIDEIHNAYASHSAANIIWGTHKLKSTSRAIGAGRLAKSCQALENAAREDDWPNITRIHNELDRLFASVVDFIRNYKPERNGTRK